VAGSRPVLRWFAAVGRLVIVVALPLAYFASAFKIANWRPPDAGLGDWLDPYFINFILEHWYYSLSTFGNPLSPLMYFPMSGTLGYSHSLILYAPFYVVLRPFVDEFQAYSLALMLVLVTGAACLVLLLRRIGLGLVEALALGALFVTSSNVINGGTSIWSQTASVFLIPPMLLISTASIRLSNRPLALTLAWLSGCLGTLLLSQDYYTGALTALLLAMLVVVPALTSPDLRGFWRLVARSITSATTAFVQTVTPVRRPSSVWLLVASVALAVAAFASVHPIDRTAIGPWRFSVRDPLRPLVVGLLAAGWYAGRRWSVPTRLWPAALVLSQGVGAASSALLEVYRARVPQAGRSLVVAFTVGGLVGLAVFFWIYLPSYLEHPSFPREHLMNGLKSLDRARWQDLRGTIDDFKGFDTMRPFVFVLGVGLIVWLSQRRIDRRMRLYALWFSFVSLLIFLVPLRYGDLSFWSVFFGWLPGLGPIRDPKRIIHIYELGVVLATAFALSSLPPLSWPRLAIGAMALLLLVMTTITTVTPWQPPTIHFNRPRSVFNEWVLKPIAVDPSCRSFFIKGASERYMSRAGHMWSLYAMDSMFIAMKHSIPTLNGYSAWTPTGWQLANPQESDYLTRVNQWIAEHNLRDVCQLDIDARTMTRYEAH
jgi:hypothetical protein